WPAEGLERGAQHRVLGRRLRVRRRGRGLLHAPHAHRRTDELAEVALELRPLAVPHLASELIAEREHDRAPFDRDGLSLHELRGLRDAPLLGSLEELVPCGPHALERDTRRRRTRWTRVTHVSRPRRLLRPSLGQI